MNQRGGMSLAAKLVLLAATVVFGFSVWMVVTWPITPPPPTDPALLTYKPPPPESEPITVLAVGDSITNGPDSWYGRLAASHAGNWVDIGNAAVPGDALPDILARLERDVLAERPDAVVMMAGSNGAGPGTVAEQMRVYDRIVDRIRAAGVEVVLVTVPPSSKPESVDAVLALNEAIRGYAVEHGLPLADFFDDLATPRGMWRAGYAADRVHPTEAGQVAMYEGALRTVDPLLDAMAEGRSR